MRKQPVFIRKMSTRGRVTIPKKIIVKLRVVKGSRYLFKMMKPGRVSSDSWRARGACWMRKNGITITPVRPGEKRHGKVRELNKQEMERLKT